MSGVEAAAVVVQYHVAMLECASLIVCKWDVAKHYTPYVTNCYGWGVEAAA